VGWVYLKKHLDSIASYVKDGKIHSTEPIRGRIVDAIVYLTLIGGMIEERGEDIKRCNAINAPTGYMCNLPSGHVEQHTAKGVAGNVYVQWD
jgi:hypothetical protein